MDYVSDLLMYNLGKIILLYFYCSYLGLVSLQYEYRLIFGKPPSTRGYHACILADSRLFLFGGFNGQNAFNDVHILDLAAGRELVASTAGGTSSSRLCN